MTEYLEVFTYFWVKCQGIPIQTCLYGPLPILLVVQIIIAVCTITVVTELSIRKTVTVTEKNIAYIYTNIMTFNQWVFYASNEL